MPNNPIDATELDINAITQIASVRAIKSSEALSVASLDTTQTFGTLQSFSAGISASSVAVSGRISSTEGVTFGSATNFMAFVPQSSATNGGLWIKEGVFQIGGSALLQGSGSVNYSGNTEHLYVYGYQTIENGAYYQRDRTGLTVRGGTGQSVPLFNVTRGGTSAVQVDQNGTLVAILGLSAAGGVTFSGTFSGATATFSKLLSASAGVSASALTVSTTGTTLKTSAITMASGVTASNQVVSQITLNAYNADSGNLPPVPYTRTGYITADSDYDLKLRGGGDSYIGIYNDSISIGDIDGANNSARISFDTTEYVTVTGKLKPDQLVYELDEANGIPAIGAGDSNPIYMKRWNSNEDPVVYTYPFSVSWSGAVSAFSVTSDDINGNNYLQAPIVYANSIFPQGGQTLYINSDAMGLPPGSGGGNSVTHIGDLANEGNNTYITVDDSVGNITVNASNGTVALSGVVTVNSQIVSTNARGWFL